MDLSYILVLAMPIGCFLDVATLQGLSAERIPIVMAIGKKKYIYIYKVEDLNLQAPTGPPHSTMRQNFELWNVSFQM